jgi:hypothetical protein
MVKDLKVPIYNLEKKGYSLNFRGFVWIQGESDAGNDHTASDYQANLELLVTDLRMEVLRDANLKVILGVDEQHNFVNKRPLVIKAQKQIAQNDRNIIYTTMYGLPKADGTHLTPAGLIEHGYRIFNAFKVLQNTDESRPSKITLADQWEFVGVAVEEPGYTIWGSSPIIGEDGKVHLFVARWPGTTVGGFFLYFKSENTRMGLAIAENFKGPYVQVPFPVTQNNKAIEDGYAFMLDGEFCLLITDNHGLIEKGGGYFGNEKRVFTLIKWNRDSTQPLNI